MYICIYIYMLTKQMVSFKVSGWWISLKLQVKRTKISFHEKIPNMKSLFSFQCVWIVIKYYLRHFRWVTAPNNYGETDRYILLQEGIGWWFLLYYELLVTLLKNGLWLDLERKSQFQRKLLIIHRGRNLLLLR